MDGHAGEVPPPQSHVNVFPFCVQSVYCEHGWPAEPVGPESLPRLLPELFEQALTRAARRARTVACVERGFLLAPLVAMFGDSFERDKTPIRRRRQWLGVRLGVPPPSTTG